MLKRRRQEDAIWDFFVIMQIIVEYLPLDYWGHLVLCAIQKPQASFVPSTLLLRWRPYVSIFTFRFIVESNNEAHFSLLRLQNANDYAMYQGWYHYRAPQSLQILKGVIPMLSNDQQQNVFISLIHRNCDMFFIDMLIANVTTDLDVYFESAIENDNLEIAKKLISSKRVSSHTRALRYSIRMFASCALFEFLFGLGYTQFDIETMRQRFLICHHRWQRNSEETLNFLFAKNVIRVEDTAFFFVCAFKANDEHGLQFFGAFSSFWPHLPVLENTHILSEAMLNAFLRQCNTLKETLNVIPNLAESSPALYKSILNHAFMIVSSTQVNEVVSRAFRIAWKNCHESMVVWLWTHYEKQRATFCKFLNRPNVFKYCKTDKMLRFLFARQHATRGVIERQRHILLSTTIAKQDRAMLQRLCQENYIVDQDIRLQSPLMDVAFDNVNCLEVLWRFHAVIFTPLLRCLFKRAIKECKMDVVLFLFEKMQLTRTKMDDEFWLDHIPILCKLECKEELVKIRPCQITHERQSVIKQEGYTALPARNDDNLFDILWNLCPLNADELLAEEGLLFYTFCATNIPLATYIWSKRIITNKQFALFCEQNVHMQTTLFNFLQAIHFDT